jgi:hypothetical protein
MMANPDSGIKNIIIQKKDLPAYDGKNSSYTIRYKIVSSDGNRSSHWSPQRSMIVAKPANMNFNVAVSGPNVVAVWDHSSGKISDKFDVYVKWSGDTDWSFVTTVSSSYFATLKKQAKTTVQVAVQQETYQKQRFENSTLWESGVISLA